MRKRSHSRGLGVAYVSLGNGRTWYGVTREVGRMNGTVLREHLLRGTAGTVEEAKRVVGRWMVERGQKGE